MSMVDLPSMAPFEAIDSLMEAARANRQDPFRKGSLLDLEDHGQLVMTGDLHGNLKNFQKLRAYANLERTQARHIILHELLHLPTLLPGQADPSYWLLVRAAQFKLEFPEQVHFLLGNHEVAQLTKRDIVKDGLYSVASFQQTVLNQYGEDRGQDVLLAVNEFIESLPLAARTPNRIFLSHSLPDANQMVLFDPKVIGRNWKLQEAMPGGSVYLLTWGRQRSSEQLDRLAEMYDCDIFIHGHIQQEMGYEVVQDRVIILASEHSHGVFLPFDLHKPYTVESLVAKIRKIVSIG
jgi:Icc-related predicted phosphoesterase